jgi:hypothetical protein
MKLAVCGSVLSTKWLGLGFNILIFIGGHFIYDSDEVRKWAVIHHR